MGQSLLDGNLPYVELWDNKPPLAFAFFAFPIAIYKSIVAVRIAGTVCVFVIGYMTYLIGTRIWCRQAGFLAAIFSILFISVLPSGEATMSEIVALVPTMGALLILLERAPSLKSLFFTGFLLSIATLVRTNLGCLVLVVGMFVAFSAVRRGIPSLLKTSLTFIVGGLVPLVLTFLPYLATNTSTLFIDSVFVAPIYYSSSLYSPSKALFVLTRGWDLYNITLWGGFLGGLVLAILQLSNDEREQQRYQVTVVAIFLLAIALSVTSSGSFRVHYLIQLVPFMAIFSGYFFCEIHRRVSRILFWALLFVGLALPIGPILDQYRSVTIKLAARQPLQSDAGYELGSYLSTHNPRGESVYLMTDHIAYWLAGVPPITKAVTHPSTVGKEYLLKAFLGPDASTEGELHKIFQKRPLYVVKTGRVWYLSNDINKMVDDWLAKNYVLVTMVEGRFIYRRAD
jgi:hypothetical protein